MTYGSSSASPLGQALELPCGVSLKNRLVKSPMSDSLGDGSGNPSELQIRLYEKWAEGGVALSVIGEVQGDPRYPEKPGNLVLGEHSNDPLLHALTQRATVNGAHLWAQIGHAGALSHRPISAPAGPSALTLPELSCRGLDAQEIRQLPVLYASTARQAKAVGFSGILIHAAHGFLLSQFLSPLFNHRSDQYGGSIESRYRIVGDILDAVRHAVGPAFPIGIRINASDLLEGGLNETDALSVVGFLDQSSVDLIDISGGTYFPGAKASSESKAQGAYFQHFAQQARRKTRIPLVLTGGFKTRQQAVDVIAEGSVDMIGLARAMVINPALPDNWLQGPGDNPEFPAFDATVPGGVTAWYTMRLTALAEDREEDFSMDLPTALHAYERRDNERCIAWRKQFASADLDVDL